MKCESNFQFVGKGPAGLRGQKILQNFASLMAIKVITDWEKRDLKEFPGCVPCPAKVEVISKPIRGVFASPVLRNQQKMEVSHPPRQFVLLL